MRKLWVVLWLLAGLLLAGCDGGLGACGGENTDSACIRAAEVK